MKGMLLLTTVGAKTGIQRTVPLAWFPDGDGRWLIVGSAGGAAKHPAWFINLATNPDQLWIEIGARKIHVRPELLKGEERETSWHRIVARARNFAGYQRNTDRELPVIRLSPAP